MSNISIRLQKCILCEACVDTCPANIFTIEGSEVKTRNEALCIACGHCVSICPADAIVHADLDPDGFLPVPESPILSPETLYLFLRSRRSCRSYDSKEIPMEILERLIDIGRFSPTGHNRQNVEFIILQDKAKIKILSRMTAARCGKMVQRLESSTGPLTPSEKQMMNSFRMLYEAYLQGKDRIFYGAPAVILTHAYSKVPSSIDNCLYSLYQTVLMAQTMGLGTCINRLFVGAAGEVPEIRKVIDLPTDNQVFGCLTVGFPKHHFRKLPPRNAAKIKWI